MRINDKFLVFSVFMFYWFALLSAGLPFVARGTQSDNHLASFGDAIDDLDCQPDILIYV